MIFGFAFNNMKTKKSLHKEWRKNFREGVFARDKQKCKVCGQTAQDAHHITDRHDIPNGGYVLSNGISLCGSCHIKAETGEFPAEDLYKRIESSYEKAVKESNLLECIITGNETSC